MNHVPPATAGRAEDGRLIVGERGPDRRGHRGWKQVRAGFRQATGQIGIVGRDPQEITDHVPNVWGSAAQFREHLIPLSRSDPHHLLDVHESETRP